MKTIEEWQKELDEKDLWPARGFLIKAVFTDAKNRVVFQGVFGNDPAMAVVKIAGWNQNPPFKKFKKVEADALRHDAWDYKEELSKIGIQIPRVSLETPEDAEKNVYLVEVAPHVGPSIHHLLSKSETPDQETLKAIDSCIKDCLEPLFGSVSPGEDLRTGIDAVCRNFCIGADGHCYYVDFVPAKIRKIVIVKDEKGNEKEDILLEYPEPDHPDTRELGYFRHYKKRGIMSALMVSMYHAAPKARTTLLGGSIFDFLMRLKEESIIWHLKQADRWLALPKEELEKEIGSMGFMDIYGMRELACAIVEKNDKYGKEELDRIFDLTHFQNEFLPSKNIEDTKKILIGMLYNKDVEKGKVREA